jgi:hypothetical protein
MDRYMKKHDKKPTHLIGFIDKFVSALNISFNPIIDTINRDIFKYISPFDTTIIIKVKPIIPDRTLFFKLSN